MTSSQIKDPVETSVSPRSGEQTIAPSGQRVKILANFAKVDGREILARVSALPIQTWNYQTQEASIRHIGPMAQDFYAAFGLGDDNLHISTIDADGIALASI